MTGSLAQVRALAWLRWQMIRTPGVRLTLCLSAVAVLWLMEGVSTSAPLLTAPALYATTQLAPAAFLGFGVLAVIAPLTAGGGSEMVPSTQLVAYPVRPSTQFLAALLLAPVNLVWVLQLFVLTAETAYLTLHGNHLTGALTTTAFVLCVTIAGQAMAWAVVGLRQTRLGRRAVGLMGGALALCVIVVIRLGLGSATLHASPTRLVVLAIQLGPGPLWAEATGVLGVGAVIGLLAGSRICGWALHLPTDADASIAGRSLRRREPQESALRQLVALDRSSVWRAAALRRGGLVLALLPAIAAIGAALPWGSLVVLPGLVAAGAGLLFGVNAFCLDGSGAVWLASLPHDHRLAARSKLIVLTETVFAAICVSLLTGSLRSPGSPTLSQVTAMLGSSLACGALVIATCMSLSVRRPHRADLRGPRDAVAPPGALAAASARLALPAGLVGLVLEASSQSDAWWLPLLLGACIAGLALMWLRRSMNSYDDPVVRARVMQAVAAG